MTLSLTDVEQEIKRRHIETWYVSDVVSNYKDSFVVAGYCSVAITDREGHLISIPALKKAVAKFMENPKYRDLNIFHCVSGNTEILVNSKGSKYLPISEIKVGDKVMAHSGKWRKVREAIIHDMDGPVLEITLSNNTIVHITDEHPVLTRDRGWVKAGQLTIDDVLLYGANVVVINKTWHTGKIYNLNVDVDNTYVGRGIIYHNSDVQIGEILPQWTHPTTGKVYKTQVDDNGWYCVCKIRGDLEIARKVREEVDKGNIRSFSIAGTAKDKTNNYSTINPHQDINDLEIYEVTLCCHPNTKIATLAGTKEISEVTTNDFVLTHNMRFKKVDKLFRRTFSGMLWELYFSSGETLIVTGEHPILTKQNDNIVWTPAEELTTSLSVSRLISLWNGVGTTNISKISLKHYDGYVYNIEVSEDNSYVADSIFVHNCVEGVNQLARFDIIYR